MVDAIQTAPPGTEAAALRVALPFVEEFGGAWLEGSVTARTALLGVMVRAMLAFSANPAVDASGEAISEAIRLIDEINERAPSRQFNGISQPLHAKLCTIRATLARRVALAREKAHG